VLPSNLLVVCKRKGEVQPRYAKLSSENLEAANQLIETYKGHVGDKKKVLMAFVSDLENQGYEYRFVRALSLLLDRKGTFVCNSEIDPSDLRKRIFQATEKHGLPITPQMRQRILEVVASQTALTTETIEEQLYADLDSELILTRFDAPSAVELLEQYNLSLAQTLLFDCTELSFKALGLILRRFFARMDDFCVRVDGPASLFKLTKRYGINIAKLLPVNSCESGVGYKRQDTVEAHK
jgi:predicted nuclease of restriction endonuclease-like RecB superfamily